jgi:hypothetical protein
MMSRLVPLFPVNPQAIAQARYNAAARRPKLQVFGAEQNKNVVPGCESSENEFERGSHVKPLMNPSGSGRKCRIVRFREIYGPDGRPGKADNAPKMRRDRHSIYQTAVLTL